VLGAVVGAGVYYAVPKVYRARAVIQVVPARVPEGFLTPMVKAGLDQRLGTMKARILSRTRLEALIGEFNLYPSERRDMLLEDVIEQTMHDITVWPGGPQNADIFSISFAYTDAVGALGVTQKLAQLFIDESFRDREVSTQGLSQFMESEAEELRARLTESDRTLREWAVHHSQQRPPQELVIENEVLQESYKTTLRNAEAAAMATRLDTRQIGEQFRLLEAARAPEKPIGPFLWPFLVVGALGGIAFRLLVRLASWLWRRRGANGRAVAAAD
jgi:hypothetical protein